MKLDSAIRNMRQVSGSAFATIDNCIEDIFHAARTNDLTGLPNALAFEADFAEAHRSSKSYYLFFGDLNGFKNVNDSLSHEAGDAALRRTGELLILVANNWQVKAYHKSGDEFAMLVPSECKDGVVKELRQFFSLIILPFGARHIELSGSFGCVALDEAGDRVAQERAEHACRVAKRRGADYVVHEWSPDDDQMSESERRLRCDECGTAFRCTLAGEHMERPSLSCPVCKAEVTNSSATEVE